MRNSNFNLKEFIRKRILLLLVLLVILVVIGQLRSCFAGSSSTNSQQTNVIVAPLRAEATEGLDLEALGSLLEQAQTAKDLENLLNQKGAINNLDLNSDGVVDFISVTELGSGNERGFSLSTEISPGEVQEIATIRVQQNSQEEQADIQIQGNEALYGSNYYYNSRIGIGDMLLVAWLFSPHTPYYSPFAWGYYPSYYGAGYRPVSRVEYRSRTSQTKQRQAKTNSPKASANALGQRSSLSNPSRSQRSFSSQTTKQRQAKTNSPKASANALGQRSSLSNPSRSQRSFSSQTAKQRQAKTNSPKASASIRQSSGSRSGSSFGGGK